MQVCKRTNPQPLKSTLASSNKTYAQALEGSSPKLHQPKLQPISIPHNPPMARNNNWQNMPLANSQVIDDRHMDMLRVYVPNREQLRPVNRFLLRPAFVFAGQHHAAPNLDLRLANWLARQLNHHPWDFTVAPIDPSFGDFIVLFPTTELWAG